MSNDWSSSDWIAVGALLLTACSLILATVVAPRMTAGVHRLSEVHAERRATYVEAIAFMRMRAEETGNRERGDPDPGPNVLSREDIELMSARMLLYATPAVWSPFREFTRIYYQLGDSVSGTVISADPAEMAEGPVGRLLATKMDAAMDAMRDDLGIGAFPKSQVRGHGQA